MSRNWTAALLTALLTGLLAGCSKEPVSSPATSEQSAEPVRLVVYSARKEHLIKPLFERYTEISGVEIDYITDKAGPLLARLKSEADLSPADVLMTVDAGNLWHAEQEGVLAPLDSAVLEANVPAHLRSAESQWFGLSVRARTIVYSSERVTPDQLSSYEALADPQWQGRLCLRTSKKVYNQSLVATMIATQGEESTEATVKGWVANLADQPFSNDTKTMEAIVAGRCDVAIVNTYYFGRLMKENPDTKLALFWPNQDGRGVHVNISGAGVTKASKQKQAAQALLEWLSGEEAQQAFAGLNQEFPVNTRVPADPEVQAWGEFKADSIAVEEAGRLQVAAVKLMDRSGYR